MSLLLERIKKERSLARESLHIYENKYDNEYGREHLAKCYTLLNEIEDLLKNFERCDDKARIYNNAVFKCLMHF